MIEDAIPSNMLAETSDRRQQLIGKLSLLEMSSWFCAFIGPVHTESYLVRLHGTYT